MTSSASGQSPLPPLPPRPPLPPAPSAPQLWAGSERAPAPPAERTPPAPRPVLCCAVLSASGCRVKSKQIRLVRSSGTGASQRARGYRAASGSRCGRGGC